MRKLGILLAAVPLAVSAASAQEAKMFKDWFIGCDNLRACTAIGFEPGEYAADGVYLKVERSGAPDAEPEFSFVLDVEGAKPGTRLALAFDKRGLAGLPGEPLPGTADGDYVTATLSGQAARNFIGALRKAKRLTLTAVPGGKAGAHRDAATGAVSLSGAVAALTFMDDRQKRAGTETALFARGDGQAESMPAVPGEPTVKAVKIESLSDPLPELPKAVTEELEAGKDDDEYVPCDGPDPMAVRLSPSLTLWGVCVSAGAYNWDYAFYFVEGGKARPAAFEVPAGVADGGDDGTLTNPDVSEDGLAISSFYEGRGLGDCGTIGEWAWDGSRFRLVSYQQMDDCRGVLPDDWPTLYRARRQ